MSQAMEAAALGAFMERDGQPIEVRLNAAIRAYLSTILPEADELVADWRKAMEGVTPGPWHLQEYNGRPYDIRSEKPRKEGNTNIVANASWGAGTAEGALTYAWIARCSPSGIAALLNLITAQAAELAELREQVKAKDEALDKSREVLRNAMANKHFTGPIASHANTALHMIADARTYGRQT